MIFRHFSSIFKEITEIKQRKSYVDTLLVRPPVLKRNNEAIFCDEVTDSSPSIQACAGDSKARGGGPVLLDHELNEEELDQTSKVDSRDCEVNNSDSHCETLDLLVHKLVDDPTKHCIQDPSIYFVCDICSEICQGKVALASE